MDEPEAVEGGDDTGTEGKIDVKHRPAGTLPANKKGPGLTHDAGTLSLYVVFHRQDTATRRLAAPA